MRDRHFMEDENELPYLVWETRDDNRQNGNAGSVPLKLDFKDIPFREFPSYVNRLYLASGDKNNIINSIDVKPGDCTFSMHQSDDAIRFAFKVKNEYVTTKINVSYNRDSRGIEFRGGYTYHDDLESMQWFRDAVRRVEIENGYNFDFCYKGQSFECRDGRLLIKDDFECMVMFEKEIRGDHYGYRVDFTRKKLVEYHTYPFHEYYLFF